MPAVLKSSAVGYLQPNRAFTRFWKFTDQARECSTAQKLCDVIDTTWMQLYKDHPPAGATFNDLCLYISYELVYTDSQKYKAVMSEKFLVNYEATRILFTNPAKAHELLFDNTTTAYIFKKSGSLLSQRFGHDSDGDAPVKRLPPCCPAAAPAAPATHLACTPKVVQTKRMRACNAPGQLGATTRVMQLLIKRSYTDAEILAIIQSEYPDRTEKNIKTYIGSKRSDINSGRYPKFRQDKKIVCLYRENDNTLTDIKPGEEKA